MHSDRAVTNSIKKQLIESFPEFDNHQNFYSISDSKIGLQAYIAIHRKGPKNISFGATRLYHYDSENEAMRDALRLSKLMSYKAAFAGLPYGGAKAVIMETPLLLKNREQAFSKYAEFVETLGGQFITGTDVGVTNQDLETMAGVSSYIVGTKVNPEKYTAQGLLYSIEATLKEMFFKPDIRGHTFSILGLGKVGSAVLELIYPFAEKVYASDLNENQVAKAKKMYPGIITQTPEQIITQSVDVFIPCALSGVINSRSIILLKCMAIVGGSNNQLEDSSLALELFRKKIIYAPDFVVNAGGLISVVHEYENSNISDTEINSKLQKIGNFLELIYQKSHSLGQPPAFIAQSYAQDKIKD